MGSIFFPNGMNKRTGFFLTAILGLVSACTPRIPFSDAPIVSPKLVTMETARIRDEARTALSRSHPEISFAGLRPGYVMYLRHPTDSARNKIVAEWLGTEPLELEKGDTPAEDKVKFRKLQVKMTVKGKVLEVQDTHAWLYRGGGDVPEMP